MSTPPRPDGADPRWQPVLDRAAADPEFRRALLDDPRSALARTLGIRLPDDYRVRFVEREPGLDALIVLPDPVGGDELDLDQLDAVAGGTTTAWEDPPPPPPES